MTKTPEEMAEEWINNSRLLLMDRPVTEAFLAGYKAAMDQLADAGKVNSPKKLDGWISVKDKLPEVNQYEGKLPDGTLLFHRSWYDSDDEVTHWMILPEPPKEGE